MINILKEMKRMMREKNRGYKIKFPWEIIFKLKYRR